MDARRLRIRTCCAAFLVWLASAGAASADEKYYPSVPYVFNLLMDPMEKMDPQSKEWGYSGRRFFAEKMWAPAAASSFLAAHLKRLQDYPPRQAADSLSMKKAILKAMQMMDSPNRGGN